MIEFYKKEIQCLGAYCFITGLSFVLVIAGGFFLLNNSLENFINTGLNPLNSYVEKYNELLNSNIDDKETRKEMLSKLTDVTYSYTQVASNKQETISTLFISILGSTLLVQTGSFYNKRVELKEKLALLEHSNNEGVI